MTTMVILFVYGLYRPHFAFTPISLRLIQRTLYRRWEVYIFIIRYDEPMLILLNFFADLLTDMPGAIMGVANRETADAYEYIIAFACLAAVWTLLMNIASIYDTIWFSIYSNIRFCIAPRSRLHDTLCQRHWAYIYLHYILHAHSLTSYFIVQFVSLICNDAFNTLYNYSPAPLLKSQQTFRYDADVDYTPTFLDIISIIRPISAAAIIT